MDAGGPEVKAAAQVALAGPASYISYFLAAVALPGGAARRRAGRTRVRGAGADRAGPAVRRRRPWPTRPTRNRVAALANNKAAEAAIYADQAARSAQKAAEYAGGRPGLRCRRPELGEPGGTVGEHRPQRGQLGPSQRRTARPSRQPRPPRPPSVPPLTPAPRGEAAEAARAAAKAAGAGRGRGELAAKEASAIYATRLKEIEETAAQHGRRAAARDGRAQRSTTTRRGAVSSPRDALAKKCLYGLQGLRQGADRSGEVQRAGEQRHGRLRDARRPEVLRGREPRIAAGHAAVRPRPVRSHPGCRRGLRRCGRGGLVRAGATGSAACCRSARRSRASGSWPPAAKGLKNSDKLRNIKNIISKLAKGCNSFAPGTPVLLANGSRKPIEQLRAGDKVVSTDPATGVTSAKPVTATIVGSGAKVLVTLTVKGAGGSSASADQVTATERSPVLGPRPPLMGARGHAGARSVAADLGRDLGPGHGGGKRTQPARVHNLSVADFRAYYVFAGDTPILVHNASQCFMPIDLYSSDIGQLVLEFRRSERIEGGRNLALVEWEIDGIKDHKIFPNDPGELHSEQLMDRWLRDNGIPADAVKRIYSERVPCTKMENGRTCLGIAQSYPNAEVSYSLTGSRRDNRKAIMDVMIGRRR